MLPKKNRLTAAEVRSVLAAGAPRRVGAYGGKYVPGRVPLGVAVVVTKRVAKSAAARNRLRRAAYRELERAALPPDGSLVLFIRPAPQAS